MKASAWKGWLVGVLALAAGTAASAEDRFRFGTKDVTVAGGYSFSHSAVGGAEIEDVDGFQLLPHFGYILSDERGPGWVRGNFELLAEPALIHFSAKSESATAVGLSAVARWIFATDWVVRPYVEVALGILAGELNFRQTDCDVNYIIAGGPGLLWFLTDEVAVTASYRFQHVSNAGACEKNLGLNSSLFIVGISYLFR